MRYSIFDAELNSLLRDVNKIHCLSFETYEGFDLIKKGTLYTAEEIEAYFNEEKLLVGHNVVLYDIPALEKVFNCNIVNKLWCTLGISFALFPIQKKHGLELWGTRYGYPKVEIKAEEWETLSREKATERCERDVEINRLLFHDQMKYLFEIYDNDEDQVIRYIDYLTWKMDCLKDQEEQGIPIDIDSIESTLSRLEPEVQGKIDSLASIMPQVIVKSMPKKMFKKDLTISVLGLKWLNRLEEEGLPEDTVHIYEIGNPISHVQLKKWLFQLGWNPVTFKENDKGVMIPQVSLAHGQGICQSIKDLYTIEPDLMDLEGLYMLKHRQGVMNGYIKHSYNGKVFASAQGFTNTLRLQHTSPVVNLPGVDKPWGQEVREALCVPDDEHIMIGCDISGLEDNTKQHFMFFFDPDYVNQMRVPGFDPHLDIALFAKILDQEDVDFFKHFKGLSPEEAQERTQAERNRYKKGKKGRSEAKTVNFAGVYGAGPPKIAETLKITLAEAKTLHKAYWSRNKAVKQIAAATIVKFVRGQKWQYNPISGFWYYLKAEKDRFSTLNQGSGSYVFDMWLRRVRIAFKPYGINVIMQYHDELLFICHKSLQKELSAIVVKAMEDTNDEMQLNVRLGISVDPGNNYAECH